VFQPIYEDLARDAIASGALACPAAGVGMPGRNPEAVRQRAIEAARQRSGRPATPSLDPVFVALNPGALPTRERSEAELYQWIRREEQYASQERAMVADVP
jgi:hypothetical protein